MTGISLSFMPPGRTLRPDGLNFLFMALFNSRCCLLLLSILGSFSAVSQSAFTLINPYTGAKKYPYKASFHNHTAYYPEYTHASIPPATLLRGFRDYPTTPPYGIIGISDHGRVTTPWNVFPSMVGETPESWAVDSLLWIPSIETNIGNSRHGGLYGDMLAIDVPLEKDNVPDWEMQENEKAAGGWIYRSKEMPASISCTFSGAGLCWIAMREPAGGIAAVWIDNKRVGEADLHADQTRYRDTVFSISGLKDGEHFLRIAYDRKGQSTERYMGVINMDMLVMTGTGGSPIRYPADSAGRRYAANDPSLHYGPLRFREVRHPAGRSAEVTFHTLSRLMHCFLVLCHPNARFETSGPSAGTQLWTSAGYTYAELDSIFGDPRKGIAPLPDLPNAFSIGNKGYDFSARTGFRNAEDKWDSLLRRGCHILGFGADDTHTDFHPGGWVVIYTKAASRDRLTTQDVMESLFSGNYYSSQGPVIDVQVRDNVITVHADKPALIEFISKDGVISRMENTTEASYHITGSERYVRARVTREDKQWKLIQAGIGRRRSAWTNPVYVLPE